MKTKILFLIVCFLTGFVLKAQEAEKTDESTQQGEQSRESQAMDATATQWSFQAAYQSMPDYYNDIVNGSPRPAGLDNYFQLRVVAPVPLKSIDHSASFDDSSLRRCEFGEIRIWKH